MVKFLKNRVYSAYIIETKNYESTKKSIMNFAVDIGFEKNVVFSNNHPDIYYLEDIDDKDAFSVSRIREQIIESANYMPQVADKKFFVLYDTVNLTELSQNMLLKTLEDSPEYDTFFLVTSNKNHFLETIKSRCMIIDDVLEDDITDIYKLDFIDESLRILGNLKYESITSIMEFADNFVKKKEQLKLLIKLYRYVLRDALTYKFTLDSKLINLNQKKDEIIVIANAYSFEELGKLVDNLNDLSKVKTLNINFKLAIYEFCQIEV